jgi:ubiquinone/menaquinone biosynthesis C-methylase UbiE
MKSDQEHIFIKQEADAYFERNYAEEIKHESPNHSVIKMMKMINLPKKSFFIDLGGGAGTVAAGITKLNPDWNGTVLEPSKKAIKAGSVKFPWLSFIYGSLTKKNDMPNKVYDLAIISMVFSWIDRSLLSQAIANIDNLVKPNGYIIIRDFYAPYPRANNYHHKNGLFTYKQDYTLPFKALNIYTELYKQSGHTSHSSDYDENDPYDLWTTNSILRKDLTGKYIKKQKK